MKLMIRLYLKGGVNGKKFSGLIQFEFTLVYVFVHTGLNAH